MATFKPPPPQTLRYGPTTSPFQRDLQFSLRPAPFKILRDRWWQDWYVCVDDQQCGQAVYCLNSQNKRWRETPVADKNTHEGEL